MNRLTNDQTLDKQTFQFCNHLTYINLRKLIPNGMELFYQLFQEEVTKEFWLGNSLVIAHTFFYIPQL